MNCIPGQGLMEFPNIQVAFLQGEIPEIWDEKSSQKHTYIILNPLYPTFIKKNWGLQGYTLFFLFLLKNIDCAYSLEPPQRGGSNVYPQSMFWAEIWKISEFLSEKFQFLVVKFSVYLNRRVFVMNAIMKCCNNNNDKSKWYLIN